MCYNPTCKNKRHVVINKKTGQKFFVGNLREFERNHNLRKDSLSTTYTVRKNGVNSWTYDAKTSEGWAVIERSVVTS